MNDFVENLLGHTNIVSCICPHIMLSIFLKMSKIVYRLLLSKIDIDFKLFHVSILEVIRK
jgi:hypothetical protein